MIENITDCERCNFFKKETEKQKKYMLQAYKERDDWKEQKHQKDREIEQLKIKNKKLTKKLTKNFHQDLIQYLWQ